MTFGLACCAIEMISGAQPRWDFAERFGMLYRASPRQSDLMIVSGTVTYKMAPLVYQLYEQMPDPKWVISMGACANFGGPFDTYATLQGVDRIIPVDVYVSGLPAHPGRADLRDPGVAEPGDQVRDDRQEARAGRRARICASRSARRPG